jgi:hypothetical protein
MRCVVNWAESAIGVMRVCVYANGQDWFRQKFGHAGQFQFQFQGQFTQSGRGGVASFVEAP